MNCIRSVKRAEVLGYCMGVRKAIETVTQALAQYRETTVYTYGPLIHNPAALKILSDKGVKILHSEHIPDSRFPPNTPVIIRAHGISPQKRKALAAYGALILDATCPRVVASQKRAARYAAQGCTVILAGDKNHGEIKGIAGYVDAVPDSRCIILQNAEEAGLIPQESYPAVLIAQTTIKQNEYRAIADILLKKNPQLTVLDTICPATDERQQALIKLCAEVDAVIVVGGKESANTRRLLQTALDKGLPAWLAEETADVPQEVFTYRTVGLAAGASTPDFSIDSIETFLLKK